MTPELTSSGDPENTRRLAADTPSAPAPATFRADLLEQVIRETLAASALEPSADLREKLLDVARRYPQAQLELDPVVIEMVKAVLGPQFERSIKELHTWDDMVSCIAQTLFADATARERLNSLWTNLSEASRG